MNHVCCYSVNHSNGDKCTLNYCVNGSIGHFKFPKVLQAHTLGEVGILGTVLLRVSFETIHAIFIEIGSYLTEREQKISWHSFLRHGVDSTADSTQVVQNSVLIRYNRTVLNMAAGRHLECCWKSYCIVLVAKSTSSKPMSARKTNFVKNLNPCTVELYHSKILDFDLDLLH